MKGLCLHCQGNEDGKNDSNDDDLKTNLSSKDEFNDEIALKLRNEGLSLINKGLGFNIKSSICWRVKGLAHKSDRDYENAMKCYKKAHDYDNKNQRILTDLSSLQIQLKKFDDFKETRKKLWLLNQDKLNYISYFVSLYLDKQYQQCLGFLNDEETLNKFITDKVELNEVYLLKIKVLLKQEKYQNCLKFLNEKLKKNQIVDQLNALQIRLEIEIKLNKIDDATKTVLQLIDKNPENLNYHNKYQSLIGNEQDLISIYKSLQEKYPKCNTIKRILLECCNDEKEFEILLNEYLIKKFKKSVMSLYNDIRSLYKNKSKQIIIDKLINLYRNELSTNYRFNEKDDKLSASPMCLLWVNYFYCSRLIDINNFELALKILNETINIVPTCIELFVLKGKLYKYVGNKLLAFKYLNIGRELDKADRYLNTKCTRYAFRCNKIEKAEEIVSLFLKKTEGTLSLQNLQVIWYQIECGESHLKLKQYGPSIKQYENIYYHFETFWKNQTDFHRYSYRKCAIGSYLQLLDWEYNLRNHPFFIRASKNAINIWFKIFKLQKLNDIKNLEFGSSKQIDFDKNKKRQKDEKGWKLIHCKYPLKKAEKWINYLLPLIDYVENPIFIYSLNIKYLFYTKNYKKIIENINEIKIKYKQFINDSYLIYNIYIIIFNDFQLFDDEEIDFKQELQIIINEYDIKFLKKYYNENLNDFDKLLSILKLCLEINEIKKEFDLNHIIDSFIKLECLPLQCLEICDEIKKYIDNNNSNNDDGKQLLAKMEKYIETKYPLQLRVED